MKSTRILEGPEHLMCTLMRFKYDRAAGRKSKVFTDVDYELRIRLPVSQVVVIVDKRWLLLVLVTVQITMSGPVFLLDSQIA